MANRRGRGSEALELSDDDREQLDSLVKSRSLPAALAARCRIVLIAAEGVPDVQIAKLVGMTRETVGKWRRRFADQGVQGLHDELRPGRPRTVEDAKVAAIIQRTLQTKPEGRSHWSSRSMGEAEGVSRMTVQRVWKAFNLKPHRRDGFKLSNDPFFVEKVRDVVGLYLDPPAHAIVLCVDEKSQCQALERTQPGLPMDFGYTEGYTHDYVRHGTTNLFAALEVATGKVIAKCLPRHRHQDFLTFLRHVDANVPADLDIHIVMDNYATHKHSKVNAWFLHHPRYKVHFTPTYSSWLNQVEIWFNLITSQQIRRSSTTSVKELHKLIDKYTEVYNNTSKPFAWTATAESILAKIGRLCERISVPGH